MSNTSTPEIDLELASEGDCFVTRDGTRLKFKGKINTIVGEHARKYRLETLGDSLPFECYRMRNGRFSSFYGITDPRDILCPDMTPGAINLELHDIGQFYMLRNGSRAWLQEIIPPHVHVEIPFRWRVNGKLYTVTGKHLLSGEESPLDIVGVTRMRVAGSTPESKSKADSKANIKLDKYPLRQRFRRRDGEIVTLTDRKGSQTQWPFKVGEDTYTACGSYMNSGQPHPKDLVAVIPMVRNAGGVTRAKAWRALRILAAKQGLRSRDELISLVDFLQKGEAAPA